jgi:hypothetical protein
MGDGELVASYRSEMSTVRVYLDRVEIGMFSKMTYAIQDIQSVEIKKLFLGKWIVNLVLKDGTKTDTNVALWHGDAKACQDEIMVLVNRRNESLGARDGVNIRCTVLGGSGTELVPGISCTAVFGTSVVCFFWGDKKFEVNLNQLTTLKLDGPGKVSSDAGVIGGGFGLEGAAIGIGIATLINALTAKSTTNTILHLTWEGAELFLHTSIHTPEETRLRLSHAFTVIQSREERVAKPESNIANMDIASQLERLVALKNEGHLTDAEFGLAKANLIARM